MKLLKLTACLPAVSGGNVKRQTMMEDAVAEGLSDRGSTPLRSTKLKVSKKSGKAVFMRVSALLCFWQKVVLECFKPSKNALEQKNGVKNSKYGRVRIMVLS